MYLNVFLDALANIEEADKHKIDHPRKAMSLYLKAGKGEMEKH